MKQITETNDNLSLMDIRKKDFYELKEKNNTNDFKNKNNNNNNRENNFNNNNKNIQNNFDIKNISLIEYVNYSPKLSLMVF
jgi:hypothetical protein